MSRLSDPEWADRRRLEDLGGETRVNFVRMASILAFYAQHLARFVVLDEPSAEQARYHVLATSLTLVLALEVLLVHAALLRRFVPSWLKFASTGVDLLCLTGLLLAGSGPRSSLLPIYFLVLAAAPLRFSVWLVASATAASLASYAVVLGDARWRRPELGTERADQVVFALALLAAGALGWQMIRQVRRMAAGYSVVVEEDSP